MIDPEGRTTFWNPAAERMLGYTTAEATGQNLHSLIVPPRFHAAHHRAFPEFQRSGTGQALGRVLELFARRKDGVEIAVALSLSAVRLGDGWHAVGILRDITERQRAQAALEESEERYRTLFSSSRDAMMTLVPPDWTYAFANPSALALFRLDSEAHLHSFAPGQLSPERQADGRLSSEAARDAIAIAVSEGVHFCEWTHRRADGETFPGTILLARIEPGGQSFLQATISDITAQKQAEEAVRGEDARAGVGQSPARSGRRPCTRDGPGGRGGEHGEGAVPRQHEPRDPHPDERRHRHDRAAARHRPLRRAAPLRRDRPRERRRAAERHQRHPRLLEDRGRHSSSWRRSTSTCGDASRNRRSCWPLSAQEKRARVHLRDSTRRVPTAVVGDPTRLRQILPQPRSATRSSSRERRGRQIARRARVGDRRRRRRCASTVRDTGHRHPGREAAVSVRARSNRSTPRRRGDTAARAWGSPSPGASPC